MKTLASLVAVCASACGGQVTSPGNQGAPDDSGTSAEGGTIDASVDAVATTESGTVDATSVDTGLEDVGVADVGADVVTPVEGGVDAGCTPACSGNCIAGRCFVTLATRGGTRLAVSANDVYWLQVPEDAVMMVPLDGGMATTIAAGDSYGDIVVDTNDVYWTDQGNNANPAGAVLAMPLDGGTISTIAAAQSAPDCLAVDGASIYWKVTVCPDAGGLCGDAIVTAPLDGGVPTTLTAAPMAVPASFWGLALDSVSLYWTAQPVSTLDGRVAQMPFGGGAVTTLVSGIVNTFDIAADGTNVYFSTETGPGGVYQLPVDGGALLTLTSDAPYSFGITVDATSVYWAASGSGMAAGVLAKVPIGGGAVTTLATGLAEPYDVAVDDTSVYFTNASYANGSVVRVTPK